MKKRITVVLGLAIFLANLAASVWSADDRVVVAVNDPAKVPAMMVGMTDEQAVQFARDLIAALNQLSLSPEKRADRLALLTVGLISGTSMQSMQQVAAAVVSAVRVEDLAKTTAVVAMVVSVRQADVMAAAKTTRAVAAAAATVAQPEPGILGVGVLDRKPRVIASSTPSVVALSGRASSGSSGGGVGTLSSHTTIVTPPASLPDGRGMPGEPPPPSPNDPPVRPPAPPPAPYYDGQ